MPIYEYQCNKCLNEWELLRKRSQSKDDTTCPSCGHQGNFKIFCSSFAASIPNSANNSMEISMGNAMSKAKIMRAEHENRFGTYDEFMGERAKTGSNREIDRTQVDIIGNMDSDVMEKMWRGEIE